VRISTNKRSSRRELLALAFSAPALRAVEAHVDVPVLLVTNQHAKWNPAKLQEFRSKVWDEAVRCFSESGIRLQVEERMGEVLKYPGGRPRFIGLDRKKLNVVLTDHMPLSWDHARNSAGVARIYEGVHLCLISVGAAHGNRVPMFDVNTVVHELLHVLLQDIFATRGDLLKGYDREARVDWHATRLWLFRNSEQVRRSAREYVEKLRSSAR
jgi:hypothetical protein